MIQAVIVAGGKGTRLASVSGDLPKPLVPVAGVPIIERQISLLTRYNVEDIYITTGYRGKQLWDFLGNGSRFGVRLHQVWEEHPLGTAGALSGLRGHLEDDFFVLYADVLVHMDLARLLLFHRESRAAATLVVHPNDHPYDSDLVELDIDGRIQRFHPSPRKADGPDLPNLVSAGLYVLSPVVLETIEAGAKQDFVSDVFPRMLGKAIIAGYRTTEYLKDMGTPERLKHVEEDLVRGMVEAQHWDNKRPAAILDRDGVLNIERGGVHSPEELELLPGVAGAIRRVNRAGWVAALATNQPDIAKGFLSAGDLERIHRRLETRLGAEGAWLDAISYCPHHPNKGFPGERKALKIECACRKPNPGMLVDLANRLPLAVEESVFIGDTWRDFAAAHAAGMDSIAVSTGHDVSLRSPSEYALVSRPDVMVNDLTQAVSLLLDQDPGVETLGERILRKLEVTQGRPLLILVGGLSRSGKSVAVFRLRRLLRRKGVRVLWVRMDDWIMPVTEREPESTLASRYQWPELQLAMSYLARGRRITAPGYEPYSRGPLPQRVTYDATNADVVVAEGVPALLVSCSAERCFRVFVDAPDEEERLQRVHRLYRVKGLTTDLIAGLIAERQEEHEVVTASAQTAQFRLVPQLTEPVCTPGDES
jgi:histidinol-phosphate phosphatase family protein